jgi:hypothetical protein
MQTRETEKRQLLVLQYRHEDTSPDISIRLGGGCLRPHPHHLVASPGGTAHYEQQPMPLLTDNMSCNVPAPRDHSKFRRYV